MLTILLFEDTEKPREYLDNYFGALANWNEEGLRETEIILITQKQRSTNAHSVVDKWGIPATIVKSDNPFVGGHPIWDAMKDMRKAWPQVPGDWITVNHAEFIWCPNRLKKTIEWLKQKRLYLALGNLRRPATDKVPRPTWRPGNCDKRISDRLTEYMRVGNWKQAAVVSEELPTLVWPLWRMQEYGFGECKWSEDVFFADRRWMESYRMIEHGGELPFQDIWDLMGAVVKQMQARNLALYIQRMKMDANRIIHTWHPKYYKSWTPEIRDWFMADSQRWKKTAFLDSLLWKRLFKLNGEKDTSDQYAKYDLRRGKYGTLTRYEDALRNHLLNGGHLEVHKFFEQYGLGARICEYAEKDTVEIGA